MYELLKLSMAGLCYESPETLFEQPMAELVVLIFQTVIGNNFQSV